MQIKNNQLEDVTMINVFEDALIEAASSIVEQYMQTPGSEMNLDYFKRTMEELDDDRVRDVVKEMAIEIFENSLEANG